MIAIYIQTPFRLIQLISGPMFKGKITNSDLVTMVENIIICSTEYALAIIDDILYVSLDQDNIDGDLLLEFILYSLQEISFDELLVTQTSALTEIVQEVKALVYRISSKLGEIPSSNLCYSDYNIECDIKQSITKIKLY